LSTLPAVETVAMSFILRLFNDIPSKVIIPEKFNVFAGEALVAH
jgi:hypothetical protein